MNGGAIYNLGSITDILGSTFTRNTSTQDGGAIYNEGTIENITLENASEVKFEENSTDDRGGAIYNKGTINNISEITFSANTSGAQGGYEDF